MRKILVLVALMLVFIASSLKVVSADDSIYTISYYDGCGLFSLYITSDNKLYSVGDNSSGELGINSTTTHYDPQLVASDVKDVSVGRDLFAFYVTTNNEIYAWGNNQYGELGLGGVYNSDTETNYIAAPKKLNISFTPKMIRCGKSHTLILDTDGNVWSCGANRYGQLGYSNSDDGTSFGKKSMVSTLTKIDYFNNKDIVSIACNDYASYCLASDGKLYSFGDNYYGELGINSETQHFNDGAINEIQLSKNITSISTYGSSIMLLTEDGEVYGFGRNHFSQLGLTGDKFLTPTLISSFKDTNGDLVSVQAIDILCGGNTSFILGNNNKIYASGMNSSYNTGISYTKDTITEFSEVNFYESINIKDLKDSGAEEIILEGEPVNKEVLVDIKITKLINSCGDRTFVLSDTNQVYSFGDNAYGQVCSGNTATITTPVKATLYRIQTYEVTYNAVDYMTGPIIVLYTVLGLIILYIVTQEIKIYKRKKGQIV